MKAIFFLLFISLISWAQLPIQLRVNDLPICPAHTNGWCKMHVDNVHPTQAQVGMDHMKKRAKKLTQGIGKVREGELTHFLYQQRRKTTQFILGPGDNIYINDRHHFSSAMMNADIPYERKFVVGRIVQDWSDLSPDEFWNSMVKNKWAYLKDVDGKPIHYSALPSRLQDLVDDPLRSFVPELFDSFVVTKLGVPFEEFFYGDFLRSQGFKLSKFKKLEDQIKAARKILEKKKGKRFLNNLGILRCQGVFLGNP